MPPQNLRIAGPTPLPDAVREAGGLQMINHRGPEFQELVTSTSERMRPAFGTTQDVLILTSSGTGGLEAAVVSFLSPGDPVLGVSIGNFGDRFAKIASVYGADVTRLEIEWGQAAQPDEVRRGIRGMVAAGRSPRAVLLTYNETSTGVTNPLAPLAAAIREEAPETLILVDGISAVGAMPFEMDAWDLDVVVTGSQKAWMIPPGLAMVAASERAWRAARDGDHAALLPRPGTASRGPPEGPDALDTGRRHRLPARGRPGAHRGRGPGAHLRAPRGLRGSGPRRAPGDGAAAPGRPGVRVQHRDVGVCPRWRRVVRAEPGAARPAASSWPAARAS